MTLGPPTPAADRGRKVGTVHMSKRRLCILGGCGGIGRSLVTAALADGYEVAVMDLKAALARHPVPTGVLAIEIDGSDGDSVTLAFDKLAAHWTALDGFVNAAGFMVQKHSLAETSTDEFDVTTDGNLRTTFLTCKAAMTLLERGNSPSSCQHRLRPWRLYPPALRRLLGVEGWNDRADQDIRA